MSEIFSLDGVQTLKGKRKKRRPRQHYAILASLGKKKWDLKKFLRDIQQNRAAEGLTQVRLSLPLDLCTSITDRISAALWFSHLKAGGIRRCRVCFFK